MKEWIETDYLFCDDYKAVALCEYSYEMTLIKQLIEIAEKAVDRKKPKETWDHNGICALFARSIVDYSKMAYDTFLLGHFSATNMINRVIIENNVCLDVILRNEDKELWKYYLAYSYKKSIKRSGEELSPKQKQFLEDIYVRHQIDPVFLQKSKDENGKDKRAFIDRSYGWTYKINNQFSFEGLCKLVNKGEDNDFRMMSEYSHGTAIHLKLGESYYEYDFLYLFWTLSFDYDVLYGSCRSRI